MKKILLVFFALPFFFACSGDDEKELPYSYLRIVTRVSVNVEFVEGSVNDMALIEQIRSEVTAKMKSKDACYKIIRKESTPSLETGIVDISYPDSNKQIRATYQILKTDGVVNSFIITHENGGKEIYKDDGFRLVKDFTSEYRSNKDIVKVEGIEYCSTLLPGP